jgi:hypothetical protein
MICVYLIIRCGLFYLPWSLRFLQREVQLLVRPQVLLQINTIIQCLYQHYMHIYFGFAHICFFYCCQAQPKLQVKLCLKAEISLMFSISGIVGNEQNLTKYAYRNVVRSNSEGDLNFLKRGDNLNFLQMEDDLIFLTNGRWPHLFWIWKTTSIFSKMEDDLNFEANGKRPQYFSKWKNGRPPKSLRNGGSPSYFGKWKTTQGWSSRQIFPSWAEPKGLKVICPKAHVWYCSSRAEPRSSNLILIEPSHKARIFQAIRMSRLRESIKRAQNRHIH